MPTTTTSEQPRTATQPECCAVASGNHCDTCGLCEDHCDCYRCSDCQCTVRRGNSDWRACCSCCSDCCACISCERCGSRYAHVDDICGECARCFDNCGCTCGRIEFFDMPFVKYSGRTYPPESPFARLVSVEIEAIASDHMTATPKAVRKWNGSIVKDGSLNEGGFEINVSPASGDMLVGEFKEICAALDSDDAKVDDSCGLHCHVDATDMSWWTIRQLVRLYAKLEDALFSIVDPRRRFPPADGGKHYCAPCGTHFLRALDSPKSTKDLTNKTHTLLYNTVGAVAIRRSHDKYQGSRYYALNLHSWLYRGTVELRMHHGTVDFDDCFNWALLCTSLVETAKNLKHDELRSWPIGIRGLLKLAPTLGCKAWVTSAWNEYNPDNRIEA